MPFLDRVFAGEQLPLDAAARAGQPGEMAQLSDGDTYYELGGPTTGTPVVLVHGFSVPNFLWDPTFRALTQAGFRVLRYDLFGRGFSDRPAISYDKGLYVRQLLELLDFLKMPQVDVVSLSMGGVIAAEFAFRFPKRVRKLSFVDPAGFDLEFPLAFKLLSVPGLGELILGLFNRMGSHTLLETMLADFYRPSDEAIEFFVTRYEAQMKYRGFKRALLSSLRTGMLDEDLNLFRRLAELDKPVQLIWGEEDKIVPYKYSKTFTELVPGTQFHSVSQAGHIPHFERPEIVNPLLIDFLRA
jgi:pimeloyl-ACP methyl ester carboxylesterase